MADTPFVDQGANVRVGNLLVQGSLLGVNINFGTVQRFSYVATGLEGASFVVALPATRASTAYQVQATGAGLANFLSFDAPQGNRLVDRFTLVCSAAPTAGDIIAISVGDLS